jgi:DNA-binding beta-propeller fold protein YncE
VDAVLDSPEGIALRGDATALYVADTANNRVRLVTLDDAGRSGVIETVLGDGSAASVGAGAPARALPVRSPRGLALDERGNLFVTGQTAVRLVVAEAGLANGDSAVVGIFGDPPRLPPADLTACVESLVLVEEGVALVADACLGLLVELVRGPLSPDP